MAYTYSFLGDSITDSHRLWLSDSDGLGNGYVSLLASSITETEPDARIFNKGHDGFTLPFLLKNLERDCISGNPDFVTVLIGINDIGIAMNTGKSLEEQHFPALYDRLLDTLTSRTHASVLCVCPFIFPYPRNMFPGFRSFERRNRSLPGQLPAITSVLSAQDILNNAAEKNGYSSVTTDGIHLTRNGHALLSHLLLPLISRCPELREFSHPE